MRLSLESECTQNDGPSSEVENEGDVLIHQEALADNRLQRPDISSILLYGRRGNNEHESYLKDKLEPQEEKREGS